MSATILPFAENHLAPAAELLAARRRRDRRAHPDLPPACEDPAAALPVLRGLVEADGADGVVAIDDDAVVGYLLGSPSLRSPTDAYAGVMHPRSAGIDYAGHAAAPGRECALYARMYAALAGRWVADGLVGHYVRTPLGREATDPWADLGFGHFITMGARSTDAPSSRVDGPPGLEVRRATAADEGTVQALTEELFRTFADPPIFLPLLPETAAARRRFVAGHLADPACAHWLAFVDGRPVALQAFEEPVSPHWHQSPLLSPSDAPYLVLACTAPEARGMGIGAALFGRTMAWAREAGYRRCTTHYLTASRAAPFWRGLGFRPVSHWLRRLVDERAVWASGSR